MNNSDLPDKDNDGQSSDLNDKHINISTFRFDISALVKKVKNDKEDDSCFLTQEELDWLFEKNDSEDDNTEFENDTLSQSDLDSLFNDVETTDSNSDETEQDLDELDSLFE